ncbi:MAG: hypothetical protein AB7T06_24350 [Kofleriaceae bacterium]
MDITRDRRLRAYTLIPFVVLGILAGALGGLGFGLGFWGEGAGTRGNPAGLVFFVAPAVACWAIGWLAYRIARRFAAPSAE